MKKTLLTAMIALALAACGGKSEQAADSQNNGQTPATAANSGATDALNIYNWSNYVDEDTVDEFKQANNLKLVYDLYENNETLEAKVLTGKSGYDLVVPGIAFLPRQIQAGAYQKIHKDLIPTPIFLASTPWRLQPKAKRLWAASYLKTAGICCSNPNTRPN